MKKELSGSYGIKPKKKKRKKALKIILIAVAILICVVIALASVYNNLTIILTAVVILMCMVIAFASVYVYNNLNYDKAPFRQTMEAGYEEKQVSLNDGTVLNYVEGPDNGPSLLLIHGQVAAWGMYTKVLPELSKYYHVYAVDCHGHGKSSKDPEKYSGQAMGEDFAWFIENVIGEPAVVSGHSSGGLLTTWLAANSSENVLGIVLEDPPLFSTEASRCDKTFAQVDTFQACHSFLNQNEEDDFALYYLENCYWINYFGNAKKRIIRYAVSYREKHPEERLKIFFFPPSITGTFYFMDDYDPRFGDAFYDCSWLKGFDHAEALSKIKCPSVLIHTNWKYDENGILMGAMSGEDAERAHLLIENNVLIEVDSGHSFSWEKPNDFIEIMIDFLNEIQ